MTRNQQILIFQDEDGAGANVGAGDWLLALTGVLLKAYTTDYFEYSHIPL